ncbi:GIY-YIG nuclease family protein [Apilactobacillus xinyiensis]|uniref:GIY-YIG nuclease family protein n=1 Tax=Apilactobacillus xinyiensis TaxID=2841032 RepID=UPI003364E6B8
MSNEDDYFSFKYAGYNNNGSVLAYYVPRDKVSDVLQEHDNLSSSGVYLLLNLNDEQMLDCDTKVYVGQAKNIAKRTKEHDCTQESWWNLAILIIKNSDTSFSADEILYLERYMYDMISDANKLNLFSGHRPSGAAKVSLRSKNNFENDFKDMDMLLRVLSIPIFHMRYSYIAHDSACDDEPKNTIINTDLDNERMFYCKARSSDARAVLLDSKGKLKVLKGSKVSAKDFSSSFKDSGFNNYRNLEKSNVIKDGVFIKDYIFKTPSGAATIVYKSSANGKTMWKDANGVTLKEYLENENK